MTEPTLEIRTAALRGSDALWIEYEVSNPADAPALFLFNLLNDQYQQLSPPPNHRVTPELAQTCFAGDETVLLLQGRAPTPGGPGVTFYAPIVPLCTRVAAGAALRATIRAPVPVLEWTVYNGPQRDPSRTQPTTIRRVRLAIDCLVEPSARLVQPDAKVPDAFRVTGQPVTRLTATFELAAAVALLMRTDDFRRFS